MYLDEIIDVEFDLNLCDRFDVTSEHIILFKSNNPIVLNLNKKFQRLVLNFLIDKNFNGKIDIEIYADGILVASYVSMFDKNFILHCDLNFCDELLIKSNSDTFESLIYDSILFESSPNYSYTTLSRSKFTKSIIIEDNVIIVPVDTKNKKYLLTCLNFIREFSGLVDRFKIYVISSGFSSDLQEICNNFSANFIALEDDIFNTFILNVNYFIKADNYIFINVRTMVVDNLLEISKRVSVLNNKFLIAKEQGISKFTKFGEIIDGTIQFPYFGSKKDLEYLGIDQKIYNSYEIYNYGIFACNYKSLLSLNSFIKNHEFNLIKYLNDENNEFKVSAILNTFLIKSDLAEELPSKYNVQLYHDDCSIQVSDTLTFLYKDKKASILYFNGLQSEYKYNKLKNYALDFFKSPPIKINKIFDTIEINADCVHMSAIEVENCSKIFDFCVYTFAKSGDDQALRTWLWSVKSFLKYDICVVNVNDDTSISSIISEFNCTEIKAKDISNTESYKNLIFAVQKFIFANFYIFIDLYCVILENLISDFENMIDFDKNKIYLAGENYENEKITNLKSVLLRIYNEDPIARINEFELDHDKLLTEDILNPNIYIASKETLNLIYDQINNFNQSFKYWAVSTKNAYKFILNYSLIILDNYQELDLSFNFILQNHGKVQIWREKNFPKARFLNKQIKVLNFEGSSRYLHKFLSIYPVFVHKKQTEWESFLEALDIFLKLSNSNNLMPYFYPNCHKNYPHYQLNINKFIEYIKNLIDIRNPHKIIEAGSGHGLFTAALASLLPENGTVLCVEEPKSVSNLPFFWYLEYRTQSKISFILDYPEYAIRKLIDKREKFDMLFINGNQTLEECYTLSMFGRNLLEKNDPMILHSPGRDSDNVKFIANRLTEKGFSVINTMSSYPEEDTINFLVSTDNLLLNVKHKITIMTYIDSAGSSMVNFINSIKNSNYPKNKLQLIIIINSNHQMIKHHLNEIGTCASLEYIEVQEENELAWNLGLKHYLHNHNNYGMILWRANLITDDNFIESLSTQNFPVVQPILCAKDKCQVLASNLIMHKNTAIHISPDDLNNYYFVDWVENAPIFAVRSKWFMLWKNDGFKYCNLHSNVGLEGWLFKNTRSKSYLIKNTSAWVVNDKNIGNKAIINNGKIKIYQKIISV